MAQTYIVSGTLRHGVVIESARGDRPAETRIDVYHDGDEFSTDDPKLEAQLRAVKTILTAEEYAAAAASEGNTKPQEALAAARVALEDENAALKARLAELEVAANQGSKSPKAGDK